MDTYGVHAPVFTPRGITVTSEINKKLDALEESRPAARPVAPKTAPLSTCYEQDDAVTSEIHRRLDALGSVPRAAAAPPPPSAPRPAAAPKAIKAAAPVAAASSGLNFKASDVNEESMNQYLKGLFEIGDTNGDGVLQPRELAQLLQLTGFNLDASTILDVVQAADVDGDGLIQYEEFVPLVRKMLAEEGAKARASSPEGANPNLDHSKLDGAQLGTYLTELFKIADTNGDGVLQATEYVSLMRLSGLKFSDELVLKGLIDADTNQDGVIDYEELVAFFKKILGK